MKNRWSILALCLGLLWLAISLISSPSYISINRNGVDYKIKYLPGQHSPYVQRARDGEEMFGRGMVVAVITTIVFLFLKKKERGS